MYELGIPAKLLRLCRMILSNSCSSVELPTFWYRARFHAPSSTLSLRVFCERMEFIALANRGYYGLNGQLINRDLSRSTKLILYKTLILPVLLYGAEAWTLLNNDAAAFRVFERKVLRKIFGPVRVGDDFRIRYNSELYELLNDLDVVQCINIQRLRWLGHVVRVEEDAPARRVFDAGICGSRRRGRPCIRWKDQIEEILSSIGVTNWRRRARSRGA